MSTFEIPVEAKALGKGRRDRHSIYGGQSLPEASPPLAEDAPMALEEMAVSVPPSSTTQLTSEKAPSLRTSDKLTETDHPQTWATVPGSIPQVAPQSEAAPVELIAGAGGGSRSSARTPDDSRTVAQLQDEASARGLPTSGTKAELIERLKA
jgi:hypothetical protein